MHSLCGKTEVTIWMPGNRSNGLDIYIRTVTHGHLFPLPFKRYCFQRLIFGFFSCGLLLLGEVGGSLGKDSAVTHGVAPAWWMPQGGWAGRGVSIQPWGCGSAGLGLWQRWARAESPRALFQVCCGFAERSWGNPFLLPVSLHVKWEYWNQSNLIKYF